MNPAVSENPVQLIQAINVPNQNRLKIKKFVFSASLNARTVPKREFAFYKNVRLVKDKRRMYISYHFRIPPDLTARLPAELIKAEWRQRNGQLREWARFRVFEDVNRQKDPAYAERLLEDTIDALDVQKFNPFEHMIAEYTRIVEEEKQQQADVRTIVTLSDAVDKFLRNYTVNSETWKMHAVVKNLLAEYFEERFRQDVRSVTSEDLLDLLQEYNQEREWTKGTYNDKVRKIKTLFGALTTMKLIPENISASLKVKPKAGKQRHTPFDDKLLEKIKKLLKEHEMQPYGSTMLQFLETIYYTCTRPVKETRQLKCKDVNFEEKILTIDPLRAKGGAGGTLPMDEELIALFREMGVDKAPAEHYIFGKEFRPGPVPFKKDALQWFWREKIRRPNNLSEDYTIYGAKHTRVIHLYKAGATVAQIQRLCRHESPTMTEKYLRDLGLLVDKEVLKKTRSF